ncbi:UNVERIFIED_CONTAM: hypothetical protein GTU68_020732 [Idotea baltica]|nr:hypothetical protein [Idotea baltica]
MELENLKYPTGRFKSQLYYSFDKHTQVHIAQIQSLPQRLKSVVENLSEEQLNTPYRPDGWTVRQLIHHIVDSHINSYVRYRWALTEDTPIIKAYDEKSWAQLPDAQEAPIALSLHLLEALHARWSALLTAMSEEDFQKKLAHPDWEKNLSLSLMTHLYSWHGNHHLAHVTSLIERKGW